MFFPIKVGGMVVHSIRSEINKQRISCSLKGWLCSIPRRLKMFSYVLICLLMHGSLSAAENSIDIVVQGKPAAIVVVAPDATKQVKEAAKTLVKYINESTGVELPLVSGTIDIPDKHTRIHVGLNTTADIKPTGLDKLDADGFVIHTTPDRSIIIAGASDYGTEFGVYEFLERYLGVRWLLPRDDGDDVPAHETISIPVGKIHDEPKFFSRLFGGLKGETQEIWARRNRMHGLVEFHHNLNHLFSPEKYTQTHPSFFPIKNGKRYLPPNKIVPEWQPCFSEPETITEAINSICEYFEKNPQAKSYSLGVNDSRGFCECDKCNAAKGKKANFLGLEDVSDLYYGWCNQVIEGVLKKYPDKIFGCLAYSGVAAPPKQIKVNSHLIPFMSRGRMKWADPDIEKRDMSITEQWHKMCPRIGWYDYFYGFHYLVPRVWFHKMAECYRYAYANGVVAHYAEAYPNWGEGPKLYVSLKLQWNPEYNVDELLNDWYCRAVGPDAAADLAAYYSLWEDFWTRRILKSKWFNRFKKGQFLPLTQAPNYLNDVTQDDLNKSRKYLEAVLRKTKTQKQKARAELLFKAYQYYELSVNLFQSDSHALNMPLESEANALSLLDYIKNAVIMQEERQNLVNNFINDPVMLNIVSLRNFPAPEGRQWGIGAMSRLNSWINNNQAVQVQMQDLAKSANSSSVRSWAQTALLLAENPVPISKNSSFEDIERGVAPANWKMWIKRKRSTGSMLYSSNAAHTGNYGILCKGIARGGPNQFVPVEPGRYAVIAYIRIPRPVEENASIELVVERYINKDRGAGKFTSYFVPSQCDWQPITLFVDIPDKYEKEPISKVMLLVLLNGFGPTDEVYIDDVAMYRLD